MIIEGDWTHLDEIPYIESEMIIEQPIIRSQGKNLFDVGKLVQDTNGSNFNSGGYRFPLINFEFNLRIIAFACALSTLMNENFL
mgnify:CR=1 FL=1